MPNMPPPINGSGTGTINASSVSITWQITPSSGFKKADGQESFTYTVNAKDQSGQPVNVTFNSVSADNATPSDPGWSISGGSAQNSDETTGTVKSETTSTGNLKVEYVYNEKTFTNTASQELKFLLVNLDIIHPSSGLLPESEEITKGGLVAIKRNNTTPTTQLKMHKLSGFPNSEFKLEWNSNKIKIWKDSARTQSVESGTTSFQTSQDTTVYLEGVTKSTSERDINVALKTTVGGASIDPAQVKLTVVQAEFPVVVKAFIRYLWTKPEEFQIYVPPNLFGIPAGVYSSIIITGDIVASGDNRTANISDINVSYRLRQMLTLTPYTDLHSTSYTEADFSPADSSHHYDRVLSLPTGYQNDLHGFILNSPPVIKSSGKPRDLSNDFQEITYRNLHVQVNIKGSGEDGAIPSWIPMSAIPNIDWDIDMIVDCTNKISPIIKAIGLRDGFPAYEINVLNSESNWQQLYYWFPPTNRQAGPSTLSFMRENLESEVTLE